MSLYSQPPPHYGPPAYAAPPFQHAPLHGYPYHATALPTHQPYAYDRAAFRQEYTNRLTHLTINSRPIIQNLTMFASQYLHFADEVAQCIEAHIRRVPHYMKLPSFYLLDMISKNIFEYARHFVVFVVPLFLETYAQVDDSTKSKMEELVLTWRNGSPTGTPLFGNQAQESIERGIWGVGSLSFNPGSVHVTKSQVLSELEFTLNQKERTLEGNPYDTLTQNHITVLHQLRNLVQAGVTQEELQQILAQLRTLVRSNPIPPSVSQPSTSHQPWQQVYPQHPQSLSFPASSSHVSQAPYSYPAVKQESIAGLPSTSTPSSISDILSNLVKAGVVSNTGTPLGAGTSSKEEGDVVETIDHARETSRQYRDRLLSRRVQLTTSGISKTKPLIHDLLYNELSLQCKQCGVRFADNMIGKKNMEEHLDNHFIQNRKANLNVGRGHSRSWFIALEDWMSDVADPKGKGRAYGSRPINAKEAAAAEAARRETELRAQFVVVPPGDEAKPMSCPICKEPLKSEFLEDDEDWVWRNAIKKDDRIYHATCHAEALMSTSSLAARLRNDLTSQSQSQSQSRSGTPERVRGATPPTTKEASRCPDSKLVGKKRKADEGEGSSWESIPELEGTPPTKKLAVTA